MDFSEGRVMNAALGVKELEKSLRVKPADIREIFHRICIKACLLLFFSFLNYEVVEYVCTKSFFFFFFLSA